LGNFDLIDIGTKMVDLADRGELPDPDDKRFYLEIDAERQRAIICFVESLRFHAEYNGQDDWASLVTSHGFLTPETADRVAGRLQQLISKQGHVNVSVEHADYLEHDDEPSLGLEIVTDYQDDETFDHWLDRIGWPVIATTINVTDPGTFNSAYLFSGLS
jgi:hypothetical protein